MVHVKSVLSAMSSKLPAKSPPLGFLVKLMDLPLIQGPKSSYQSSLDSLRSDFQTTCNSSRHSCSPTLNPLNLNQLSICIVFCKNMLPATQMNYRGTAIAKTWRIERSLKAVLCSVDVIFFKILLLYICYAF